MSINSYDPNKRIYPQAVSVKRVNAIFLDTYIFQGKYPVRTIFPRDSIELPVGIYIENSRNRLKMMGMDYYGTMNSQNFTDPDTHVSPWISYGVVANGDVNVTVVASDHDLRDSIYAEIMSAYFSHEGRCWFSNRQDVCIHGYNVIGSTMNEFDVTLGAKTHYLYTATLAIEFIYDIVTTKILNYIEDIKDYVVVTLE